MKFSALLFVSIIPGAAAFLTLDSFIDFFLSIIDFFYDLFGFNDVVGDAIEDVCNTALDALGLSGRRFMTCACEGEGTGTLQGEVTLDCEINEEICLMESPDWFCGRATFSAAIDAGVTGFKDGSVSACALLNLGWLDGFEGDVSEIDDLDLCLGFGIAPERVIPGFELDTCEFSVNGKDCTCTMCDSGVAFNLVCDDLNVNDFIPAVDFGLPTLDINLCTLLDFSTLSTFDLP